MGTTFASLSHGLHQACTGSFRSLGHVHQVLAGALGYKSFAAYKASTEEPPVYDDAKHVVIAHDLVEERLRDLGYPPVPQVTDAVFSAIKATFQQQLPEVEVHASISDLGDAISETVEESIENSDDYNSEFATTNATGGWFDLEFDAPVPIDTPSTELVIEATGTSSLDQDPERVYFGDVIDVRAAIVFPKLGRRVLGEPEVRETGASVQHDGPDLDDKPQPDSEPEERGV
jgi:hypothetical protein